MASNAARANTLMTQSVASPLTVILEHLEQGLSLDRALFVSYTFDAGYFERVALGPLEATGARVAVVADASQVEFDPYAARRIGRRYAPGLVHHHSAFHPKLVVLQGEERTVIGIGSANLTMSGWHSSEELWTFVTATADHWPALVSDVGTWLQEFAGQSVLGNRLSRFIRELGEVLTRPPTEVDGPKLVTNLHQPILEQLPDGPVEELNLYAPFHDVGERAVRKLVRRFQPEILRIAYQPEWTRLNADALLRLFEERAGSTEILRIPKDRYRHGKLIEWRTVDGWASLTGSPNLSMVALGRQIHHGNFELGLLTSNPGPLFPDGTLIELSAEFVSEVTPPGSGNRTSGGLQILEASLEGDIVLLELTGLAVEQTIVEAIPAGYPPDQWEAWAEVPVGAKLAEVPALAGGSWVRLRVASGHCSSPIPILVPAVFQRRLSRLSGSVRPPEIDELFADPVLADRFFQQLAVLKDEIRGAAPITVSAAAGSRSESSAGSVGWEEYLDRLSGRLGEGLLRFALGIPSGIGGHGPGPIVDWDEEVSENEVGLEGDDAESIDDAQQEWASKVPQVHSWSDSARIRAVRFLSELPAAPACADATVRLLALRMTLTFLAGGAWQRGDRAWIGVVLQHLQRIAAEPADAEQLRNRQGSLAAVSLSILRSQVPRLPETVELRQIDRVSHQLEPLLNLLDVDSVVVFCEDLQGTLGSSAEPDRVLEVAIKEISSDRLDLAISGLADFGSGIRAEGRDGVLLLPDEVEDPVELGFIAMRLLGEGELGVVQVGLGNGAVIVAWIRPQLVILRPMTTGQWRAHVYALPRSFGPETFSSTEDLPSSRICLPRTSEWQRVRELVALAGVDAENLPVVSE